MGEWPILEQIERKNKEREIERKNSLHKYAERRSAALSACEGISTSCLTPGLVGELVEALAFYADFDTYLAIGFFPDPPCGEFMDDFDEDPNTPPYDDGTRIQRPGRRARKALGLAKVDE